MSVTGRFLLVLLSFNFSSKFLLTVSEKSGFNSSSGSGSGSEMILLFDVFNCRVQLKTELEQIHIFLHQS